MNTENVIPRSLTVKLVSLGGASYKKHQMCVAFAMLDMMATAAPSSV